MGVDRSVVGPERARGEERLSFLNGTVKKPVPYPASQLALQNLTGPNSRLCRWPLNFLKSFLIFFRANAAPGGPPNPGRSGAGPRLAPDAVGAKHALPVPCAVHGATDDAAEVTRRTRDVQALLLRGLGGTAQRQ